MAIAINQKEKNWIQRLGDVLLFTEKIVTLNWS